jgi:hypothetical protein
MPPVRMQLNVYILLSAGKPPLARCSTRGAATVEAAVSQATGVVYRVGFTNSGFPSRWHGKVFMRAWLIASTCCAAPNTLEHRKAACEVEGMAAYLWWFEAVRFVPLRVYLSHLLNQRTLRCARVAAPPFAGALMCAANREGCIRGARAAYA